MPANNANLRITAVGVGSGGQNAVSRIALDESNEVRLVSIGDHTLGLNDSITVIYQSDSSDNFRNEIEDAIRDSDLLFILASLGGKTGTYTAPIVSEIARQLGIVTITIVTKPFSLEGTRRLAVAQSGIDALAESADAVSVISLDRLEACSGMSFTLSSAYSSADTALIDAMNHAATAICNAVNDGWSFSEIVDMLRASNRICILGGSARGENRVTELVNALVLEDIYDDTFSDASELLVSIAAPFDAESTEIRSFQNEIKNTMIRNANAHYILQRSTQGESHSSHSSLKAAGIAAAAKKNSLLKKATPHYVIQRNVAEDDQLGASIIAILRADAT